MSGPKKDISSFILIEHRCSCGKLLFKGLLLSSAVEIKCRHCNKITLIGGAGHNVEDENQYSMLFDDAINIVDVSPSAEKILGYSRQKIISPKLRGMNFLFKMNKNDRLWSTARSLNFQPFTFETAHIKQNGEVVPVRAGVRFIKNRTKVLALVMFQRLQTQSQKYEDQDLPDSNQADSACKFVADVDAAGMYTYVNRTLALLLGYSSEEMLGQPMFNFYHPTQREKVEEIFFRRLKQKRSFKLLPQMMLCRNGKIISFENYFAAKLNDEGELNGFHIMKWLVPDKV